MKPNIEHWLAGLAGQETRDGSGAGEPTRRAAQPIRRHGIEGSHPAGDSECSALGCTAKPYRRTSSAHVAMKVEPLEGRSGKA
jgi:hypothetical protein